MRAFDLEKFEGFVVASAAHAGEHEIKEHADQDEWNELSKHIEPDASLVWIDDGNLSAVAGQRFVEPFQIGFGVGNEDVEACRVRARFGRIGVRSFHINDRGRDGH